MSTPALLDAAAIRTALGAQAAYFDVAVIDRCTSTNDVLLQAAAAGAPAGKVIVAREQTAGRGRQGRPWLAQPESSLTFSLLWRLPPAATPAGLSLAVGVALADACADLGVADVQLKWPNDVLLGGKKLAGVLIELVPGTLQTAVIGVGLNLHLPAAWPAAWPNELRTTAAALSSAADINTVLAQTLAALHRVLSEFSAAGFHALRPRWLARCAHHNRPVSILDAHAPPLHGRCVGVDVDGALLLETAVCVQRVLTGDVSLRFGHRESGTPLC